jgi:hypothetical protein
MQARHLSRLGDRLRPIRHLLALGTLLALTACVSIAGGPGGISPSQFEFVPALPADGYEPGGWKVARLIINLVRVTGGEPVLVPCEIQVEVPEFNIAGIVTDEVAQASAAIAADIAAGRVASEGLLSAELCERFRVEMLKELQIRIPGARVRSFKDLIRPPRRR